MYFFNSITKLVTKINKMKPKYALHLQSQKSLNQNSKAEAAATRKHTNSKNPQPMEAVQWYKVRRVRGQYILKSGLFAMIQDSDNKLLFRWYKFILKNGRQLLLYKLNFFI